MEDRKEKLRLYQKAYRENNKERLKIYYKARNALRSNEPSHKENRYFAFILRKYGVTKAVYRQIVEYQGYKCAICYRLPAENKRLHIDHDHDTGRVRGLLCAECNWWIRKIENNPDCAIRLVSYGKYALPWDKTDLSALMQANKTIKE